MSQVVLSETIDGKRITVHENRFGKRPYWVTIDKTALFQRGRMRVREFATTEGARKAARAEISKKKDRP